VISMDVMDRSSQMLTSEELSALGRYCVNQVCGPGHAGAVDLYFETMAFWIVLAGHGAGDTLASGKRHKLRDFAEGGVCGKGLMNEKSI
jgi:hypothetical protein